MDYLLWNTLSGRIVEALVAAMTTHPFQDMVTTTGMQKDPVPHIP